jgi:hypothetical protein
VCTSAVLDWELDGRLGYVGSSCQDDRVVWSICCNVNQCSRIQGGLRTSLGFDHSHQMSNTNFLDEANKALKVLPLLARLLGTHHGAP